MRPLASTLLTSLFIAACSSAPPAAPFGAVTCAPGTHLVQGRGDRWCALKNGVKEGPAVFTYDDGRTVREAGEFRNNRRHGHWIFWTSGGALWQEGDWRDGAVVRLKPYLADCPDGTQRNGDPPPKGRALWCQRRGSQGTWVNNGPFMSWFDDGRPQAQGFYAEGEAEGEFTMWFPDGLLKAQGTYNHGKEQGLWLSWHDNGRLFIRAVFEKGLEQGAWVSWWEEGSKCAEGEFQAGLEQGPWVFWYPNGNKSEAGTYSTGKKDGWWRAWDADGREEPMEEYRQGLRVGSGPTRPESRLE